MELMSYLEAAVQFQKTAFDSVEITDLEKELSTWSGEITRYFRDAEACEVCYSIGDLLFDHSVYVVGTVQAKALHAVAKKDESLGIESEAKSFIDTDKIFSQEEKAQAALLGFKKYVD
ncbi:hypothetical protein [Paenibacillus eucommiae]|uniref:Uncharacterized protein n=1 Tax=Paenibacillus eucommiae TaxID=1355755 RepID=A0ABS4J7I7_9BACL|nr:hypothetical protein [Paenibacillus eucommiae]MBP1995206.1 hypothetical protein [Paenibacillus eucommiae]